VSSASSRQAIDWDAFWPAHEPVLVPLGAEEEEARNTAVFIGCEAAGGDRDAQPGGARQLLEACGLIPYEPGEPVKHRAEQEALIVNYERPGR
jgi:hypothetical protein